MDEEVVNMELCERMMEVVDEKVAFMVKISGEVKVKLLADLESPFLHQPNLGSEQISEPS